MTQEHSEGVALAIENSRLAIARAAVREHFGKQPMLEQRYGEQGAAKCIHDTEFHLAYLAQAIAAGTPTLFASYTQWAASMLAARSLPSSDLVGSLASMRVALAAQLPADGARVALEYLDHAISRIDEGAPDPPYLNGADPLSELGRSYLKFLLKGDHRSAGALISDALARAIPVADIYLRVVQPVLYEVGRLWQSNEITVAQEHYCTAATQLIMAQLYPHIFNAERKGKTMVAACVSGDLHEIGLRTVADFFELAGWDSHYLGASVPVADLLRLLADRRPLVLALSATIAPHLAGVRDTIGRVRASAECKDMVILVGGYPFNIDDQLWRKLGADACARDAKAAVDLAEDLLKRKPLQ